MEQNFVTVTICIAQDAAIGTFRVVRLRLCLLTQGTVTVLDGAGIYH